MKRTSTKMLVLLGIVTVVIAIVTNIATNQIPERWQPYLWISWPLLILLVGLLVFLTHRTSKEPGPPPPPELDEASYYQALNKRYKTLDLDALTPPQREEYLQLQLRAVFVEQSVRENSPPIELPKEILEKLQLEGELKADELPDGLSIEEIRASGDRYYKNPSTPVIEVLTTPSNRHVIVLGDPGSGKSTLARYVMLSLVDRDGDERIRKTLNNLLPVLIELRTFNALREEHKCDTFLEFLEYLGKTEGWNLTQGAFNERLNAKGAMVIFDGLDEIFEPQDRERVSQSIVGFAQTYPKTRILVTSRIVGYQRRILTDAGFSHYTLQDLNRDQVASFIARWYDLALADRPDDANRRKERILQSFDQSASVRQLAGNPMLLTIMAIIGKHQELPRERWKLYDHAVSVLIEHWDVKRHLENLNVDAPFIDEEDKKELLRRLAYRMQAGSGGLKGNYIHREQLQQEFQNYLRDRYTLPPDRAATISRSMIDQFRERNFILSLYGATVYGFVHRAFLEYFCATAFTYRFEKSREITIDQLAAEVFEGHWEDESWHEVLRLICGMLDERFGGQLIGQLLKVNKREGGAIDFNPANVELAVRCLGEIRNLNLISDVTDQAIGRILEIFQALTLNANILETMQFLEKLVDAVRIVGLNWPNRTKLAHLLKGFQPSEWTLLWEHQFSAFVLSLGSGLDEVRDELVEYASRDEQRFRCLWTQALAEGWNGYPKTLPLLMNQISTDPSPMCRTIALNALAGNYESNPGIVSLLQDRLQHDTDGTMRSQAIRYLLPVERPLIPLIVKHLSDEDSQVRSWALFGLSPHMADESVFEAVLNQALKESSVWVRRGFYDELSRLRKHDSRVRDLLLDRAKNDEDANNRTHILSLLKASYADDHRTQELLTTQTKNGVEADIPDENAP